MLNIRRLANLGLFKRLQSSNGPNRHILEQLKERSLVRVTGHNVTDFLQGLITNDMQHLHQQSGGSMYTMFLNTKGRVLHDAIIYKIEDNNTYFIECDREAVEKLKKHLKIYRVRRKVDISGLDGEYTIHALFNVRHLTAESDKGAPNHIEGLIVPCDKLNDTVPDTVASTKIYKDLIIFKDPRVIELGSRILSKVGANVKEQISEILDNVELPNVSENYKVSRYTLGVGEGLNDLPYGNCFPLECNCDYLHGISFHKGCYIGQELTARTHHTGVVRKRLMPLYFSKMPTKLPTDTVILHNDNNLGKLRGVKGNVGLALLRISKALDFGKFNVGDGLAKVKKPSWWPIEAPKEKVNIERN